MAGFVSVQEQIPPNQQQEQIRPDSERNDHSTWCVIRERFLKAEQSSFVEFISAQQIGVVVEISKEPAQPPECFGCAVNPASEGMAVVFLGFNDRESHDIKRSGRVPSIKGSFDSNQEDTFKGICAISAFVMQAGNVACHEAGSCDLE